MNLQTLFDEATDRRASDIHLSTGEPPCLRIGGELIRSEAEPLDRTALMALLEPMLSRDAGIRVQSGLSVSKTIHHRELAFCGVVFRSGDDGLAATFRILDDKIPPLSIIGGDALELLEAISASPRGLAIVAGPTMSGKATTASSIVQALSDAKPVRIFAIGSAAASRLESRAGLVTHLRVGQDCDTYLRALQMVEEADPDAVLVDNIPTRNELRELLILAESGHLVVANAHADGVLDLIQRLFESAGDELSALRRALARNLIAITEQRLLRRSDRPGRLPAYGWLRATPAVREAISAGDLIRLGQLQSQEPESRPLNSALDELVRSGAVTAEAADAMRN